jgi:hypothetical protein
MELAGLALGPADLGKLAVPAGPPEPAGPTVPAEPAARNWESLTERGITELLDRSGQSGQSSRPDPVAAAGGTSSRGAGPILQGPAP